MMANIWWSLPLTLIVFFAARKLAARYKFPLLNPLLVAMVVIIPFLMLTGISYDSYFKGCLLYTSPSPRDTERSRMPSSA